MRTKRIFSMFLSLVLVVSILFSGIKLTSYAQSGSDLKMENDWGIQNHNEPVFYSYGDIKIYRLYNPNNSDHLLTTSEKERDDRRKDGWIWESDTLRAFKEGEK